MKSIYTDMHLFRCTLFVSFFKHNIHHHVFYHIFYVLTFHSNIQPSPIYQRNATNKPKECVCVWFSPSRSFNPLFANGFIRKYNETHIFLSPPTKRLLLKLCVYVLIWMYIYIYIYVKWLCGYRRYTTETSTGLPNEKM